MQTKMLPIVLASDENYAGYMYVTIHSILKNRKTDAFCDFYLLVPSGFSEKTKNIYNELYKKFDNIKINFIDMKDKFSNQIQKIPHITYPTYYRLALAEILPQYDSALYLDCDVIINDDISHYFNIDIKDYYIAGVKAAGYIERYNKNLEAKQKIGLNSHENYINAGVTLWNLKKIREENMMPKLVDLAQRNFYSQDQDVINIAFEGNIKTLPLKYNFMTPYKNIYLKNKEKKEDFFKIHPKENTKEALKKPIAIHYSDKIKPWNDDKIYLANLWWKYAKQTPYKKEFNQNFKNNKEHKMKKIIENIFSVKNEIKNNKKHKVITLLGFKLKFKQKFNPSKKIKFMQQYNETPIERTECPLCKNKTYILKKEYSINELIQKWCGKYSFNPFAKCYKDKLLERRICKQCGINYYNYFIPDTEEFYQELTDLHPIYAKDKWDYDRAVEIVQKHSPKSILDIGCGYGYFIDKIKNFVELAEGTEFNPKAYKTCKEKGINVYDVDLSKIEQKYDMITCFQVLEHITNPNEFIKNTISLLNDNGLLLFITPNPDSELIKYEPGILELPPHHNLDISKRTYEYIAKENNLEILEYKQQELLLYDYKIYLKNKFNMSLDKNSLYSSYLQEKDDLVGKAHLVLYKKVK